MEPFVERYGPFGKNHKLRRQRSADFRDIFANLQVAAPATDESFMRKHKQFKYAPIPDSGSIRLLYLKPVTTNVPELRGSLRLHKLNKHSVYEAISYAWGEFPMFNQVINLDGKILKITDNLFAALMAYCRPDRTRVLWVDAICINQEDTQEKSRQVALMAEIYSRASLVQVWLTVPSQWTMDAIKFLKDLSTKAETYGVSKHVGRTRVEELPTVNISGQEAERLIEDAINHHVDFLLRRSYWNRVWVVQEVALANDLVVSCGHTTIRWIDIAHALEVLRGAYREIRQGGKWLRMEGVKVAWGLVQHRAMFRMLDQHLGRNHHQATNQAATQMSNRDCSDDRDRVYAMLSMTRSHLEMAPDYTKTVAEVYTEFTRKFSPNTQLYFAGLARRQPESSSDAIMPKDGEIGHEHDECESLDITGRDYLPTWVPEYRPRKNLAWAPSFAGTYSTASSTPYFFVPHPTINNIMFATGTILDMIETTSLDFDMKAPNCLKDPAFFFPLVSLLNHLLENPPSSLETTDPDLAGIHLAKTLTAGIVDCPGAESLLARYHAIRNLSHLTPGTLPWLSAIWTAFATHCLAPTGKVYQRILLRALSATSTQPLDIENVPQDVQVAYAFLNYLANVLIPERLFITHHGSIGLAPGVAEPGDLLAVINGCHTPYVVRSVREVRCGEESFEYAVKVVGPCYMHGVMRGEIVRERGEERWKRVAWRRYEGDGVDSLEGWLTLV